MIAILGGGLAGLSAARNLKGVDYLVLEKNKEVGGLCRTEKVGAFLFDYTGHLLHFNTDYFKRMLEELLADKLIWHDRASYIHYKGIMTPYPFQRNLYGHSEDLISECISGLRRVVGNGTEPNDAKDFLEWMRLTFGDGIVKHFMKPYNEKLWSYPLDQMLPDWVGRFVPRPSVEELRRGATENGYDNRKGYNVKFLYHKNGGIEMLPKALTGDVENLLLEAEVKTVDVIKRVITTRNGWKFPFKYIISTIPLHLLLGALGDLPDRIRKAMGRLEWTSVYNLNLGIQGKIMEGIHWIYFPEKAYSFYRIGFPHNLAKGMVPDGCSSVYAEVSHNKLNPLPPPEVVEDKVIRDLVELKIIESPDQVVLTCPLDIKYAYVVYHLNYRNDLDVIHKFLNSKGIYSIGRYGRWEYSSMEDAVLQGVETAHMFKEGYELKVG